MMIHVKWISYLAWSALLPMRTILRWVRWQLDSKSSSRNGDSFRQQLSPKITHLPWERSVSVQKDAVNDGLCAYLWMIGTQVRKEMHFHFRREQLWRSCLFCLSHFPVFSFLSDYPHQSHNYMYILNNELSEYTYFCMMICKTFVQPRRRAALDFSSFDLAPSPSLLRVIQVPFRMLFAYDSILKQSAFSPLPSLEKIMYESRWQRKEALVLTSLTQIGRKLSAWFGQVT